MNAREEMGRAGHQRRDTPSAGVSFPRHFRFSAASTRLPAQTTAVRIVHVLHSHVTQRLMFENLFSGKFAEGYDRHGGEDDDWRFVPVSDG